MRISKGLPLSVLALFTVSAGAITTITGKLTVTKPEFTLSNVSGTLISNVKNFRVEALQNGTNEYCEVTTDIATARQGGDLNSGYCLFEWNNTSGYLVDGYSISGVQPTSGDVDFSYSLYFYSGTSKAKTLIDTQKVTFNFSEPAKPVLTDYKLKLGDVWKVSGSQTNRNPLSHLSAVRITVEKRDYRQVVNSAALGACYIPAGETQCEVSFAPVKLGDASSNPVGQNDYGITINSDNSFWSDAETNETISAPWNYQPSVVESFKENSMPAGYEKLETITVNSNTITIDNHTAKLALAKPAADVAGDWWAPDSVSVHFTRDSSPALSENVTFDSNVLYVKNTSLNKPNKTIQSNANPVKVGDKFVYTFDVSNVEDGYYSASTSFINSGGIVTSANFNDIRINKVAPKMNVFKNGYTVSEGSRFSFAQELVFGAFNSFDKDVDITGIVLNGANVPFNKQKTGVVTLPNSTVFVPGENTFTIQSLDSLGNAYQNTIKLIYEIADIQFNIVNNSGLLVSHTKESNFSAVNTKSSDFCSVTTNESQAIGSTPNHSGYCLFEWVGMEELERDKLNVKGTLQSAGDITLGYKIYAYFGAAKTKTEVASKIKTFSVEAPIVPKLAGYSVKVGSAWIDDNSEVIHNPDLLVNAIRLKVTPVNYTLNVIMPDFGNCLINAFETECTIPIDTPYKLGNKNYVGYEKGSSSHAVIANSINNYWGAEEINETVKTEWEYADAQVEAFAVNAREESITTPYTWEVNGGVVIIENNNAQVVIDKPIQTLTGTWWLPESLELQFNTTENTSSKSRLEYDGSTLFRSNNFIIGEQTTVKGFSGPELINDKYIYTFDVAKVPDGIYDVTVKANYSFGKISDTLFDNSAVISRFKPQIGLFRNYIEMESGNEFYFDNELAIGVFNGYENGITVESVRADGELVTIAQYSDGVFTLKDLAEKLSPAETTLIEVEAKDLAGTSFDFSLPITYAPLSFSLSVTDKGYLPFQSIELVHIQSEQVEGENCRFYSDREMALKYARKGRKSCVFMWSGLPISFEESLNSRTPSAQGYVDTLSEQVSAKVEVINELGESFILNAGNIEVKTQPPEPILVESFSRRNLINGYYPVEYSGGEIVRMETTSSNGSVEMEFNMATNENIQIKNPSSRTGEEFKTSGRYDLPFDINKGLWDVIPVNLSAKYSRKPDLETTDSVNAIIVPDSSIGLALDFQDDQILSTEQVTAKITLGEYNRIDGWTYDRSKMGEWEVYIGKYDRRNIPEPFTETVDLNSDGTAQIEMPMQMIGEESQVFVAVAKAKTPDVV